jgi:hypothetical protein
MMAREARRNRRIWRTTLTGAFLRKAGYIFRGASKTANVGLLAAIPLFFERENLATHGPERWETPPVLPFAMLLSHLDREDEGDSGVRMFANCRKAYRSLSQRVRPLTAKCRCRARDYLDFIAEFVGLPIGLVGRLRNPAASGGTQSASSDRPRF